MFQSLVDPPVVQGATKDRATLAVGGAISPSPATPDTRLLRQCLTVPRWIRGAEGGGCARVLGSVRMETTVGGRGPGGGADACLYLGTGAGGAGGSRQRFVDP